MRLAALADLVPASARAVADVGYDHGLLIERLVRTHPERRVVGVERQVHAADRFLRRTRLSDGERARVDLRHGDGLGPLRPGEVEVAVMAGLGATRIAGILTEAPDVVEGLGRLVLAPVDHRVILRPLLFERGWRVVDERLVREGGRYYHAFAAEPGRWERDPETWLIGTHLFERRHPLLAGYLERLERYCHPQRRRADADPAVRALCDRLPAALERARTFA